MERRREFTAMLVVEALGGSITQCEVGTIVGLSHTFDYKFYGLSTTGLGALGGAVVGGLLGNQIGNGRGPYRGNDSRCRRRRSGRQRH